MKRNVNKRNVFIILCGSVEMNIKFRAAMMKRNVSKRKIFIVLCGSVEMNIQFRAAMMKRNVSSVVIARRSHLFPFRTQ